MSPFQRLCLDTIEKHNPTFRLLTPETFRQIEGAEDIWQMCVGLPVTRRSDLIRAWLLFYHGGIWTDADCIALDRIDLVDLVANFDLIACHNKEHKPNKALSTPFGGRAGGYELQSLFNDAHELAQAFKRGRKLSYAEMSVEALSRVWVENYHSEYVKTVEHWRYNPVYWKYARHAYLRVASDENHESYGVYKPAQIVHHLTNQISGNLNILTREQCLDHPSFACYLIRKSLKAATS